MTSTPTPPANAPIPPPETQEAITRFVQTVAEYGLPPIAGPVHMAQVIERYLRVPIELAAENKPHAADAARLMPVYVAARDCRDALSCTSEEAYWNGVWAALAPYGRTPKTWATGGEEVAS